jgi:hypothetical protein
VASAPAIPGDSHLLGRPLAGQHAELGAVKRL